MVDEVRIDIGLLPLFILLAEFAEDLTAKRVFHDARVARLLKFAFYSVEELLNLIDGFLVCRLTPFALCGLLSRGFVLTAHSLVAFVLLDTEARWLVSTLLDNGPP